MHGVPSASALKRSACLLVLFATVLLAGGCMTVPQPHELVAPSPIEGNSGKYMCPYTSDGVLADWVDKAVNAKAGATIGRIGGAYLGSKVAEQIPFVGGIIGGMVGDSIGRKIAIKASGGLEFIKKTSDLSFNSINNMAVYIYVEHSSHAHYKGALGAAWEIYPELKRSYISALQRAPRKIIRPGGN
jgi:hypothetical protein